jgi:uncharacterized protein involved in outer membrane biogenesis
MKRFLLIGGGVIVVVIAAIVVFLFTGLGSAVKTAIESIGSEATKTTVTLNEADVSITSASGALRGLVVGNPSGFSGPHAVKLDEISVTLDPASVTGDAIVLKEVVVNAPAVAYEILASGNNIDAIRANVDAYANAQGGGGSSSGSGGSGTKLIIENLYIRNGRVDVSSNLLQGRNLGTTLPEIHLTDIGKDKGGATPAEVAEQIVDALAQGVGGAVASLDIEGQLKGLATGAGGLTEGVGGVATGAPDAVTGSGTTGGSLVPEGADKAGEALKGVLGQ